MPDLSWALGMDGPDWEEAVVRFAHIRHGAANVQRVSAVDQGDLGLELFTVAAPCCAYQCYAPQNAFTTRKRYEDHRNKMSRDITKFVANKERLERLLGTVRIARWIFAVPYNDSRDLIAHAAEKTQYVRDQRLPYVTDDFQVLVHDAEQFDLERRQCIILGVQHVTIPAVAAGADSVVEWRESNDDLTQRLLRKLRSVYPNEPLDYVSSQGELFIRAFIEAQNILAVMSNEHASTWEAALTVIQRSKSRLRFLGRDNTRQPQALLGAELETLSQGLYSDVRLSKETADHIAAGSLSDWLMLCHLDFPTRQ